MADIPVGLSDAKIRAELTQIEALGEIGNVPAPQLVLILERARAKLELKPKPPPGPVLPPP